MKVAARTPGHPVAAPAAAPVPSTVDQPGEVVVVDRPDLSTVVLTGADVLRYLHTVTSQHTGGRVPGEAAAALLLSPKGKIELVFRLAVGAGRVVLDTDTAAAGALAERLRRFVFRFDVQVADPVAGGRTLLGPGAAFAAAAAGAEVPPAESRATVADGLVVHRTPLGVDLLGPGAAAVALPGTEAAGPEVLEASRVAAGLPRWGLELTDDVIAEEAGLLGSHVHMDKGCYPGQETVAR